MTWRTTELEDDLSSLRITLIAVGETPEARIELLQARGGHETGIEDVGVPLADIGFTELEPTAPAPDEYALPEALIERLAARVEADLHPDRPLWIELVHPAGVLALVPWERLLQARLNVPLLRLPSARLDPARSRTTLDVALIADDPLEDPKLMAERLVHMVERIVMESLLPTFVHVFTDVATHDALPTSGWPSGQRSQVQLYDPDDVSARPYSQEEQETMHSQESPWLRWIRSAAVQGQMDVVHLLGHGRLLPSLAAMALSSSPQITDRASAPITLVSVGEMDRFMSKIGAWSLAVSAAPTQQRTGALRAFVHAMARIRPGSMLWHDLERDLDCGQLGAAYRFLYAPGPEDPPRGPDVAVYCQPWQVATEVGIGSAGRWRTEARQDDHLSTLVRSSLERSPATPTWIAAAQRYVERTEWQLRQQEVQGLPPAAGTPVRSGLDAVRRVVEQCAENEVPDAPVASSQVVGNAPDTPRPPTGAQPPSANQEPSHD